MLLYLVLEGCRTIPSELTNSDDERESTYFPKWMAAHKNTMTILYLLLLR